MKRAFKASWFALWGLLLTAAFLGVCGACVARWVPRLEPLSNLRTHLSLGLCVLACGALIVFWRKGKRRSLLLVCGLLLVVGLFGARPYLQLLPGPEPVPQEHAPVLAVGSVNLLFGIGHPIPVSEWMAAENLDLVGFVEMKESPRSKLRWPRLLESWRADYPYQELQVHDYYGMAILSKVPLGATRVVNAPGGNGIESTRPLRMETSIDWHGRRLRVILIHPPHPDQSWRQGVRVDFFEGLGKELATELGAARSKGEVPENLLVMGDFNANEGSPFFRDLRRTAGLVDSRQGLGHAATWSPWQLSLPMVALDHILVRGPRVLSRGVGPSVRSDHRPVHARLVWPLLKP